MIVDLGRGLGPSGAPDAGIKVKMNFSGWRTVGVSLQMIWKGEKSKALVSMIMQKVKAVDVARSPVVRKAIWTASVFGHR